MIETPTIPNDVIVFPVIDRHLWDHRTGFDDHEMWHDLYSVNDNELGMMGTALIGNVCIALDKGLVSPDGDATLKLKRYPRDNGVDIPWPGMPDDSPLPLDLTALPFKTDMFLNEKNTFKKRVDRMALGYRVENTWVPYIREKVRLA